MSNQSTADAVLAALQACDLKRQPNGEYRCHNPFRPNSDSHAFSLKIDDPEHGTWHDHVGGESGSLYELAQRLGISTATISPTISTKRVYSGLDDYAQAHGTTADVFKKAGWSETMYQGRLALAFRTTTGTRHRFLDGQKPAYKSPQGYHACWYGLGRANRLATITGNPLVICNGEASSVVAQYYKVAACTVTSGEATIANALQNGLLDELLTIYTGLIIIALDCDPTGRDAARAIRPILENAGFEVHVVDLNGGKGFDLADFCTLHGIDSATALLKLRDLPRSPSSRPQSNSEDSEDFENKSESWEQPIPFDDFDLPAFPSAALPDGLQVYVKALAEAMQTPPDLPVLLLLAVCASVCAKKVVVQVRAGYIEPVNLFVAIVLSPANRKSAVFREVTAPLENHEKAEVRRLQPAIAEAETRKKIVEAQLLQAQGVAAKATAAQRPSEELKASELARELAALRIPVAPRLVADDISSERVATLLQHHNGRMAVLSAEGTIFDLMAGRYSNNGPNFDVYLKGHAGDTIRVDRVSRPPEYVDAPALTVGITIQPDVLRALSTTPGFRGRGLLGRFLYALPASRLGYRSIDPPPLAEAIRTVYDAGIQALLELPFETDADGKPAPHVLRFDSDAQQRMREFEQWIEPQLATFGELGNMSDWGGKLVGAVARIAGLLHMALHWHAAAPWDTLIAPETAEHAIQIGQYLIPHARAAYAEMGGDPTIAAARYILGWIERIGARSFTKRNAFQALKGRFKRVDDMTPALNRLEEHEFIRLRRDTPRSGPGRPSSPIYEVNPGLWPSQNTQYSHNSLPRIDNQNSEHSEHSESADPSLSTSEQVSLDGHLSETRVRAAIEAMKLASRAHAFIAAGRFDLANAEIERMPDDESEKAQLQAIIAAQYQSSAPSVLERNRELGKPVENSDSWRHDKSQAHAARRASAAGDYVLARNFAGFIKDTEQRQTVEAEIVQAENAAGKNQDLPAGHAELDNDSEPPGGRSNATQ